MSPRGRLLFDNYVSGQLNHPALAGLPMGSHVFNLTSAAGESHIPMSEITDEVGEVLQALISARRTKL